MPTAERRGQLVATPAVAHLPQVARGKRPISLQGHLFEPAVGPCAANSTWLELARMRLPNDSHCVLFVTAPLSRTTRIGLRSPFRSRKASAARTVAGLVRYEFNIEPVEVVIVELAFEEDADF
jgi:hypothetical protein